MPVVTDEPLSQIRHDVSNLGRAGPHKFLIMVDSAHSAGPDALARQQLGRRHVTPEKARKGAPTGARMLRLFEGIDDRRDGAGDELFRRKREDALLTRGARIARTFGGCMVNRDEEAQRRQREERAKSVSDDSMEHLDGRKRSRLNQARQAAVAEIEGKSPARFWGPLAGLAAAAFVLLVMLAPLRWTRDAIEGEAVTPLEDIDIVADADHLDMLEDLDFYAWLDSADAFE